METRKQITVILLLLSLILALLPLTANRSFRGSPADLLAEVLQGETTFTADQVAGFIVSEAADVQLFDLRPAEEYSEAFIPGAVSVPYAGFITSDPDIWLRDKEKRMILYSSDDTEAAAAMAYARGLGYNNTFFLKGESKNGNRPFLPRSLPVRGSPPGRTRSWRHGGERLTCTMSFAVCRTA